MTVGTEEEKGREKCWGSEEWGSPRKEEKEEGKRRHYTWARQCGHRNSIGRSGSIRMDCVHLPEREVLLEEGGTARPYL